MKIGNGLIVGVLIAGCALGITSCGGKSSEQQVKEQASKVYYLNPDERALAKANAQAYFEQSFPTNAPAKKRLMESYSLFSLLIVIKMDSSVRLATFLTSIRELTLRKLSFALTQKMLQIAA